MKKTLLVAVAVLVALSSASIVQAEIYNWEGVSDIWGTFNISYNDASDTVWGYWYNSSTGRIGIIEGHGSDQGTYMIPEANYGIAWSQTSGTTPYWNGHITEENPNSYFFYCDTCFGGVGSVSNPPGTGWFAGAEDCD